MESKFTKSLRNSGTENSGLSLLLTDSRFQRIDVPTKRRILELIGIEGAFGTQTFDAVVTETPVEQIHVGNAESFFPQVRLIEMKTTRKPIHDSTLNGFFFGATQREYDMAAALGSRYLFAFVVLNSVNAYGRPFAVLLSLQEVEARTRSKRVQFQVNFRTDLDQSEAAQTLIVFQPVV